MTGLAGEMMSSTSNRDAVAWLLKKMADSWGKPFYDKWAHLKPGEMLEIWCRDLRGITELEFRRGVAKLNDLERPPSLPEFLKACRPAVDPLKAYYEAIEGCRSRERGEVGTWSHPAIFWASVRVTAYELKTQSYSAIRGRWEAALAAELAKNQWEPIETPLLALPGPKTDKFSREAAAKMLQQIKTQAGLSSPGHVDHKRWAKVILQRHKDGDKSLTPIQIEFARQALRTFESDEND